MKSKTSCFNATILKKNIVRYWPLWALYLCYLLCLMSLELWRNLNVNYYGSERSERTFWAIADIISVGLLPGPVFLVAVIMAMAVFSYLYSARSANMMHSFPVSRLELFSTNYVSGLIFLLVPEMITFVVTMLVCFAKQITCIQYLFLWLLGAMGMSFFAYSLAVFVVMFTGQLFTVPVYFYIANYLYVGCKYMVCTIIEMVSFGINDYWDPGKLCVLSPIFYLGSKIEVESTYDAASGLADGLKISGLESIGIYAASAVVIVLAAYQLYRRRQIESAGDMVSIGIVKPIFRWGTALCGGVLLSLLSTEFLYENSVQMVDTFVCIIITMLVFGFLCFFIAEMLLQKRFRVFRKKRILEWSGFAVVSVVFLALFKLDVFGIESYVPVGEDVEQAFIYMDYPIAVDEEKMPRLLELHRQILADEERYLENIKTENGYYYTTIRYYLKDQTVVERRYPLPVSEEYLADSDSPTAVFLSWEREPEQLKKQILGTNYESNEYYSGYIDLLSDDGERMNYYLNENEIEQLVAAIERDVEEGNYADFYTYCIVNSQETDTYYNGIMLEYRSKDNQYESWDYYHNYFQYANTKDAVLVETVSSSGAYINFGPGCVNTIETLEQLEIINDTWKLMTYEEYQNLMNEE